MPAMYPEELRRLREQNPGLQYDFRGNLVDDGGYGDALAQQVQDLFYRQPDYDAAQPSWNQLYQNYGPSNGDALSRAVAGLDGYNYQNDQFVGPVLPGQTQGYTYSDYDQAGPLQPGVSNLSLPNVGFYSQWNPDTNSWVRHGVPSGGGALGASRPGSGPGARPRAATQTGDQWGLQGWTPYEQNYGTGKRDLWRGAPEQAETFPNLAYGQG